jgi:hypothetical protein
MAMRYSEPQLCSAKSAKTPPSDFSFRSKPAAANGAAVKRVFNTRLHKEYLNVSKEMPHPEQQLCSAKDPKTLQVKLPPELKAPQRGCWMIRDSVSNFMKKI